MYHVSAQGVDERMINVHYYVSNTCSHSYSMLDVTGVPTDTSMQVPDVGYIHTDDYKHVDA